MAGEPRSEVVMARQSSDGKRGVQSSSRKQATANRGGMRTMPPTRRVAGAFGVDGADRRTPARAPAARKTPTGGRRSQVRKRAA
jgi:hypothetical protein